MEVRGSPTEVAGNQSLIGVAENALALHRPPWQCTQLGQTLGRERSGPAGSDIPGRIQEEVSVPAPKSSEWKTVYIDGRLHRRIAMLVRASGCGSISRFHHPAAGASYGGTQGGYRRAAR